jgi:hypothetical protein
VHSLVSLTVFSLSVLIETLDLHNLLHADPNLHHSDFRCSMLAFGLSSMPCDIGAAHINCEERAVVRGRSLEFGLCCLGPSAVL